MNATQNHPWDDDARFDKLVDGGAPAAEYKTLLASLEDEPGGWRRCAMAFWRRRPGARSAARFAAWMRTARRGKEPVLSRPARKPAFVFSGPLLAAAASVMLAFGLGMAIHDQVFPPEALPTRFTAQSPPGEVSAPAMIASAENSAEDSQIEAMKLVIDGDGKQEVVVPVLREGLRGEKLVETDPAIPDSVLRALRMRGHDIRRQQQFFPVATGDGRHVIFPVEQYQITPISSRSY